MSKLRKHYFLRLAGRCAIFVAALYYVVIKKVSLPILYGRGAFFSFSPLHLLWLVWLYDMLRQLIPAKGNIALGSKKPFRRYFKPSELAVKLRGLAKRLRPGEMKLFIRRSSARAYAIFAFWAAMIAALFLALHRGLVNREGIFLLCVFFYLCDLICVLLWCPFRLILGNRCCTTCRIFNWDHLMMFSPLLLIPSFFALSLFFSSVAVFAAWELTFYLHPERFWDATNRALRCSECTDKLCTQYCGGDADSQAQIDAGI